MLWKLLLQTKLLNWVSCKLALCTWCTKALHASPSVCVCSNTKPSGVYFHGINERERGLWSWFNRVYTKLALNDSISRINTHCLELSDMHPAYILKWNRKWALLISMWAQSRVPCSKLDIRFLYVYSVLYCVWQWPINFCLCLYLIPPYTLYKNISSDFLSACFMLDIFVIVHKEPNHSSS